MKKKLLLGLAAMSISAMSMAADLDLTATPANETGIFQVGQTGRIKVTGKLVSEVPMLTYAVFATTDEGVSDRQDVLTLPDFLLKRPGGDKEGGFGTAIVPKVKIARVNATKDGIEALDTEKASFKLKLGETNFVSVAASNGAFETPVYENKIGVGKSLIISPTAFLSKAEVAAIIAEIHLNTFTFDQDAAGEIIHSPGGAIYNSDKLIKCSSPANGDFTMETFESMRSGSDGSMSDAAARIVEMAFSGGKTFNNVYIDALVE